MICHCGDAIQDVEMGLRTCGHPDEEDVRCPNCKGRGHEGAGMLEDDYPCRWCYGQGHLACCDAEDFTRNVERAAREQQESQ